MRRWREAEVIGRCAREKTLRRAVAWEPEPRARTPWALDLRHPGPQHSCTGQVLGIGAGRERTYEDQGMGKRLRGARARLSPLHHHPTPTHHPEAAGRAGAVPGVGGMGGEEAGPPHWLHSAPQPAARASRGSASSSAQAGGHEERSTAQPYPIAERTALEAERCCERPAIGTGAAGCAMDRSRLLLLLSLLFQGVSYQREGSEQLRGAGRRLHLGTQAERWGPGSWGGGRIYRGASRVFCRQCEQDQCTGAGLSEGSQEVKGASRSGVLGKAPACGSPKGTCSDPHPLSSILLSESHGTDPWRA